MKVERLITSDVDPALLTSLSAASLLCSTGFAQLWETMGGRPVYWTAIDDGEIVALLPGVEFGRRPVRRFQSMPDGLYSSIFQPAGENRDVRALSRTLLEGIAGAGNVKAHITDFRSEMEAPDSFISQPGRTRLVDISGENWQPPDKKLQSEIRKAQREGVVVAPFRAEQQFEGFISLMQATEQRHDGSPRYPAEFFAALATLTETDHRVVWLYCEQDGKPVVSHIGFIEGDIALHWQVYYDKAFSSLKANQLMLHHLIHQLQGRSVKALSLGASPVGASGLDEYKAKWGGQPYDYVCHVHRSRLGRLL